MFSIQVSHVYINHRYFKIPNNKLKVKVNHTQKENAANFLLGNSDAQFGREWLVQQDEENTFYLPIREILKS